MEISRGRRLEKYKGNCVNDAEVAARELGVVPYSKSPSYLPLQMRQGWANNTIEKRWLNS